MLEETQSNVDESFLGDTITLSRHDFSIMEKRVIYILVLKLKQALQGKFKLEENLFGNVTIRFSPGQILKDSDREENIYEALKRLKSTTFEIRDANKWQYFGFLEQTTHIKANDSNYFHISVPSPIIKYFREKIQTDNYSAFSAQVILTLKRKCSQKLYEICLRNKTAGHFYLTFDDFRIQMNISSMERYTRWANIEKDYIKPAQIELKDLFKQKLCDLYFTYTQEKSGRSTLGIKFRISSSKN